MFPQSSVPAAYHAPKPQQNFSMKLKQILPRVIFPPTLLWDGSKWLANRLFGQGIGTLVVPAQLLNGVSYSAIAAQKKMMINQSQQIRAEMLSVITYDHAELETFEIKQRCVEPTSKQKYIINLVGNAMCYEQMIDDMESDAIKTKCNVIGFNQRGVGNSTSRVKSANDLVTDCIAQVQRLLDKGVQPQNVILKGHSLGGATAALTAAHFHARGQKIKLFEGRSFSSITNVLVGQIRVANTMDKRNGYQETMFNKVLGWIAKPIIKFALVLTGWEMDAAKAYKKIPDNDKEYMVVKSAKAQRQATPYIKDDLIIPDYASIHMSLKEDRKQYKKNINQMIQQLDVQKQLQPVSQQECEVALKNLQNVKAHLNERKMVSTHPSYDAHCIGMKDLHDRYTGKNANHFFREFVKRTYIADQPEEPTSRLSMKIPR